MIYVGNTQRRVKGLGEEPAPSIGLFASGLDVSQWGLMEWLVTGAILYFAWKLVGDVKSGVRKVRYAGKGGKKRKRRALKAAQQQLESQFS